MSAARTALLFAVVLVVVRTVTIPVVTRLTDSDLALYVSVFVAALLGTALAGKMFRESPG